MKNRKSNKKLVIIMLILLLLVLAIGYAVFSDILIISGTANAKGTFDLEFQNAEVVKNVGADLEKTTAIISEDKNTLTINVADLSYPGAGVEFSADIVNVGTMPAEVQAVTLTSITGNEKIKITGLDTIKTDHPKLEVGDRCNIHFIVEWPVDVGEILESESTINFGLQIEYVQSTGETTEDLVPEYTIPTGLTAVYGDTLADIELPEGFRFQDSLETLVGNVGTNQFKITYTSPENKVVKDIEVSIVVTYQKLVNQITANDYGKIINYKTTVNNMEVSNWKVFYNDKTNVYLILDDYLPIELVPTKSGLNTSETYIVNSEISRDVLLQGLVTESYWEEFAKGVDGATATGASTLEMLVKSYNEKYEKNLSTDPGIVTSSVLDNTDTLYVPHASQYEGCRRYWLASPYPDSSNRYLWIVRYTGELDMGEYTIISAAIRPVVKLPSTVTGVVGEIVEIK